MKHFNSNMETWKAAYIIVMIVILTGIIKYEKERYYHNKKLEMAKRAKGLSTHALVRAENNPTPQNLEIANNAAFYSNQAEMAETYEETIKYAEISINYSKQIL